MDRDWLHWLQNFVFYYPFLMSYLWMTGGLIHFMLTERGRKRSVLISEVSDWPKVSIVVPCYNEHDNVREVIEQLAQVRYPNYDIIAVNDGSRDDTGRILNALLTRYPQLFVIHHSANEGKAVALTTAAQVTDAEFLMCIDGDSLLDADAVTWMLPHFLDDADVGAVTGNPRIRTRTTLLGRMQVGEFSSMVGLIKRTENLYGRLLTVSGVVTMFRRSAIEDVGYWSADMLTEDIDVSWKLQLAGWRVTFEPRALSWILMPETLRGLFKQRLRWAEGGIQVLLKYARAVARPRQAMMWPLFAEYVCGVLWANCMAFTIGLGVLGAVLDLPPEWRVPVLPHWHGALLALTCLLQLLVGCVIDRKYDYQVLRYFADTIWYPLAYWAINMITAVIALPKVIIRRRGKRARWTSPDRGVSYESARH